MTPSDPYSADTGGPPNPAREKLVALRLALLRLHKSLLDMERRDYERLHGKVNTGELFRLVIDHEQFAWLHNISEFVVRLDESLAGEVPVTADDTRSAIMLARKMFAPSEAGDGFQKRYFNAIQLDPAVVMEHAELARLFANEPTGA
jgi:hypothetical protein